MNKQAAKILIIEDDPGMLEAIKLRLTANSYQTLSAADGLSGLSLARSEKPDLIILDVMLPKIDGFAICRMLKFDEAYKTIPIILLSARVQIEDIERGKEVHADAYITKPFKSEELLKALADLIK